MCGIIGVVTSQGRRLSVDERTLAAMRDRLAHRGPDEAGLRLTGNVGFAHRRLSILDPDHGQQPWSRPGTDGSERFLLTFNGEIYNHLELRRDLEAEGRHFATSCDTETLACQLAERGERGIAQLRGMYAFGFVDLLEQQLLLARDPLGVKPLYFAFVPVQGGKELVFASEPTAILAHPAVRAAPDWVTASAYLSTIRTTLGERSLFKDIRVLQPGEYLRCDLRDPELTHQVESHWAEPEGEEVILDYEAAVEQTTTLITDSVHSHLLSDVPVCSLLSGGLDSSIVATLSRRHIRDLRTYCAGAMRDQTSEDFAHAAEVAALIGSRHTEVPVGRELFLERWPWMIQRLGVPLSTPNEVAIHAVAEALSADCKVTISGEGADELFAGYEPPLLAALQYLRHPFDDEGESLSPAEAFLNTISWIPRSMKSVVLQDSIRDQTEDDAVLERLAHQWFAEAGDGRHSLEAHLRLQRRFNLTGLLGRLDTATMLASVEGRTPFADRLVADFAARLPMGFKFQHQAEVGETRSKRILRDAFGGLVPASVRERPKASFPLPFQLWLAEPSEVLRRGPAREVFTEAVRQMLLADAGQQWMLAWPVVNLALWLERWWGSGLS